MHAHFAGLTLGLLAVAWLPNWIAVATLRGLSIGCLVVGAAIILGMSKRGRPIAPARSALITGMGLFFIALNAGLLLGLLRVEGQLASRLPIELHGVIASAQVEVLSLPRISGPVTRFDASAVWVDGVADKQTALPSRLRLTWFEAPQQVSAGDIWHAEIKLRSPVGTLNHSGFDYEAWLLSGGIHALGTLVSARLIEGDRAGPFQRLRARLRDFYLDLDTSARGSLLALATGDTSAMSQADWNLFRSTGTVHLMVISGLHLGLVAVYLGCLAAGIARLLPRLCNSVPAQQIGAVVGVLSALGFALLCGWTLPVKRAFVMICCAALALVLRRRTRWLDAWLIAMILVLAHNPFASLASGFWLSFGAVAVLCMCGLPQGSGARWRNWGPRLVRLQILLSLGMAPLLMLSVGQVPLLSPLCNLIAVPITTLLVVPLVLAGCIMSQTFAGAGVHLLELAGTVFSVQAWLLERLGTWPALAAVNLNPLIGVALLASFLFMFYPTSPGPRSLLLVPGLLLVLAVVPQASPPPKAEFRLKLLDVGQGLSIIVETRTKRLVFDAGASFPDGFSFGESVVVPALRSSGIRKLDMLIVSHWDRDHAGGVADVLAQIPTDVLLAGPDGGRSSPLGELFQGAFPIRPCVAGTSWIWDGVHFKVLHPEGADVRWTSRNDLSCVLLISNGVSDVLLPADVSQAVEFKIMHDLPQVDLLVAAHHGSKSSSAQSLLRRIRPRIVLVSSGFSNRFGHPHPGRVLVWRSVGAKVVNTARVGGVVWESAAPDRLGIARQERRAYWRMALERAH